ncbi:MAG: tetratricopeptide repeat protein [Spirochaetes bacterium]|nr:tetratricopeptide repeat protein [Spirochaetota bacterium]
MVLKTTNEQKNKFELITAPVFWKQLLSWVRKNYIYLLFGAGLLVILFFISTLLIRNVRRDKAKSIQKYVIISYNKVLYKSKKINDLTVSRAIKAYESGYLEKSKFLFQSALKKDLTDIEKISSYVNLANIFDDASQYDLAIGYLNNALKIDNKDGIIYHNLGIVYKHKKEYSKAVNALTLAVRYNKKFIKSYLSLASLHFYLHKYSEALDYYKEAFALNISNMEVKYNIGICYFKLNKIEKGMKTLEEILNSEYISDKIKSESSKSLGIYFASKGDHEKSLFYLKKAAQFQEDYDVYYKMGTLYKLQGEYEKALDYYARAYKLNNKDEYTVKNLAELYYRFGDNDKALLYYKYIVDNFKAKTEILLMIGEIYLKNEDYHSAIGYYKKALEYSPTPDEAKIVYINLGNLYFKQKDHAEALRFYKKALEIDKMDVNIYYNISLIYAEAGDMDNAVKSIDEVLSLNPDSVKIYLLKSKLLYQNGRIESAIINYNRTIERFPEEIVPLFELGNLYFKQKDLKNARHYLNLAMELRPDNDFLLKIYLNLSIIENKNKDYNKALDYIKKAYLLNNKDPLINYNYGLVYFNMGDDQKAQEFFYQTIRMAAGDDIKAMAYLGLGNIYFKKKDYSLARSMYNKSLKIDPDFTEAHYNLKVLKEKE